MYNSSQTELEWEQDAFESDQFEFPGEWEFTEEIDVESPFTEVEEMELAAELLEITDEAELDQFLGKLVKKAWRGIRKIGGKLLRPLGSVLKAVGKKFLPVITGALGSIVPGVGTALGSAAGALLSRAFEMEFEGLSPEDQEFETARRFVRLAGATARKAAQTPPGINPQTAVRNALVAAARQQVHGLSDGRFFSAGPMSGRPMQGYWRRYRRGIMLFGL